VRFSRSAFLATLPVALAVTRLRALADTTLEPLNIGTFAGDIGGQPYYAKDMGFFAKAGIDPNVVPFQNGALMASAIIGGSLDVGWANTIALSTAYQRGISFTILAPANMHVATFPTAGILTVMRGSAIHDARDLGGKTIAVGGLNQIADTSTKAWIDKNGGTSATARFVEMPVSAMPAALQTGHIDVAVLDAATYTSEGQPGDPYRTIGSAFDGIGSHFAASVWFSSSAWVAKHPELAATFSRVMQETARWANDHHRESAEILAKYTGDSAAKIEAVRRVIYGEHITNALVQPEIDVAAKYGLIKTVIPASAIISPMAR
jgi:NitT/TauT family transport system substrate-binding protein